MQESADARRRGIQLVRTARRLLTYANVVDKESDVRPPISIACIVGGVLLGAVFLAGCHHAKIPVVTREDVAKAEADAQKEIDQARVEARKDLKNAVKQAGADSQNAAVARATGSFDIAMANADGDHKVAIEKCLTLPPDAQQSCKDQADAQYQAATASAKAARVSKLQGAT
jgi:hypothetical protein